MTNLKTWMLHLATNLETDAVHASEAKQYDLVARRQERFPRRDKVAMEPTLDEAIQAVFGTQQPQISAQAPGAKPQLGQARAQFEDAQKAMLHGNWGDFGKSMEALKHLLAERHQQGFDNVES